MYLFILLIFYIYFYFIYILYIYIFFFEKRNPENCVSDVFSILCAFCVILNTPGLQHFRKLFFTRNINIDVDDKFVLLVIVKSCMDYAIFASNNNSNGRDSRVRNWRMEKFAEIRSKNTRKFS